MASARITGQGCRRSGEFADSGEATHTRTRGTVGAAPTRGRIRRLREPRHRTRDAVRPHSRRTPPCDRTVMTRLGAHDALCTRLEWDVVEVDEFKRLLATHTWPSGSAPPLAERRVRKPSRSSCVATADLRFARLSELRLRSVTAILPSADCQSEVLVSPLPRVAVLVPGGLGRLGYGGPPVVGCRKGEQPAFNEMVQQNAA